MSTTSNGAKKDHTTLKDGRISAEQAAFGAIDVEAKVTVYVVLACTIAASGGVLFGESSLLSDEVMAAIALMRLHLIYVCCWLFMPVSLFCNVSHCTILSLKPS